MRRFAEYNVPNPTWFRYNQELLDFFDVDIDNKKVYVKYRNGGLYEEADRRFSEYTISNLDRYITDKSIIEINYIKEMPFINIYDFL